MTSQSEFAESVRRAFRPGERGVAGLIDELLGLAHDQELNLEWRAGQCQVHRVGAEPVEVIEIAMPRSAARALLARLAALCNERMPDSVSPYGGDGELAVSPAGPAIRVSFVNTPDEQRVQLRPVPAGGNGRIPEGTSTPATSPTAPTAPAGGS